MTMLATVLERLATRKADDSEPMDDFDIENEIEVEFATRADALGARQSAEYDEHSRAGDAMLQRFAGEWRALREEATARAREMGHSGDDLPQWFDPDDYVDFSLEGKSANRRGRKRAIAPDRKSFEDIAAQLLELNARWREGYAARDRAQAEVDRIDEELGAINEQASRLANDSGLSEEEWEAIWDAGLHPDMWETGSVPNMPGAKHMEGGMSLAAILQRLSGKDPTEPAAPAAKADTATLLAEQLRAVEAYDAVDAELADAEIDLESAQSDIADAEETLVAAKAELVKVQPRVDELKKKLDAAHAAWAAIADQLEAAGAEEQYLIENSTSEYGQFEYG